MLQHSELVRFGLNKAETEALIDMLQTTPSALSLTRLALLPDEMGPVPADNACPFPLRVGCNPLSRYGSGLPKVLSNLRLRIKAAF